MHVCVCVHVWVFVGVWGCKLIDHGVSGKSWGYWQPIRCSHLSLKVAGKNTLPSILPLAWHSWDQTVGRLGIFTLKNCDVV